MRTRRHAGVEPLTSKEARLKEYILRSEFQKGYAPFSPGLMPYSAPLNYTGSIGGTEVTLTPPMDLMLHMGGNIFNPLSGGETDTTGGYGQVDIPDGKQICTLKDPITLPFSGLAAGNYFIVAFGTTQDENPILKDVPSLNYPGSGVLQQHRDFYGIPQADGTAIPRSDYDQSLVDRSDALQTVTEMVSRVGTAVVLEGDEGDDETPLIKVVWDGSQITDISVVVKIVTIAQEVTVDYLVTDADYPDGVDYKDYRGQDLADIIIAKEKRGATRQITLGERDHGTVVVIKSVSPYSLATGLTEPSRIRITDRIWEVKGDGSSSDGDFSGANLTLRTWEFMQLVYIGGLGWYRLNDSAELWKLIDAINSRIGGVDNRIDGVDGEIDTLDQRIDDLQSPIIITFDALQMANHITGDQSVSFAVGEKHKLTRFPEIYVPEGFDAYLDGAAILATYGNKLFRFGIEFQVNGSGGTWPPIVSFRQEAAFDAQGKLYRDGNGASTPVGKYLRSVNFGSMGSHNSILDRNLYGGSTAYIVPFLTLENVGGVATESDWQREHALVPDANTSGTNIGQPNFILSFISVHMKRA